MNPAATRRGWRPPPVDPVVRTQLNRLVAEYGGLISEHITTAVKQYFERMENLSE